MHAIPADHYVNVPLISLPFMDGEHNHGLKLNPLIIGVFGILSGAIMVGTLHCIAAGCRTQPGRSTSSPRPNRTRSQHPGNRPNPTRITVGIERFGKECSEEICSVCLCEFNDGEQIRVLSECSHMFHVPCIDMWLMSHSSCPLCRASTVPLPRNVVALRPSSSGNPLPEVHQLPDPGV